MMYRHNAAILQDIYEVNLSYLMLAQKLLAENRSSGAYRLGMDRNMAKLFRSLSPAQVVRLANSATLLCGFRLTDIQMLQALCTDTLDGILQQAHATILLAQPDVAAEPDGVTEP